MTAAHGLMAALEFADDDLQANRRGSLSPRQQARLRQIRRRSFIIGALLIIPFAFVAAGMLFIGQRSASPIASLVGIGVTFANAAVLGIFARYWLRITADLQTGQVRAISGRVERVIRVSGRLTTYVVKISGEQFPVSRDILKAFEHEAPYRLYCTVHARTLLSGERL